MALYVIYIFLADHIFLTALPYEAFSPTSSAAPLLRYLTPSRLTHNVKANAIERCAAGPQSYIPVDTALCPSVWRMKVANAVHTVHTMTQLQISQSPISVVFAIHGMGHPLTQRQRSQSQPEDGEGFPEESEPLDDARKTPVKTLPNRQQAPIPPMTMEIVGVPRRMIQSGEEKDGGGGDGVNDVDDDLEKPSWAVFDEGEIDFID
ncbi:hypothetical protein PABG_00093 [Paracoccidioides brasiliensis Pb03]|nr:hypothetical protein PABG_00093 [Paracoccidioides brasiliensis Pb03]